MAPPIAQNKRCTYGQFRQSWHCAGSRAATGGSGSATEAQRHPYMGSAGVPLGVLSGVVVSSRDMRSLSTWVPLQCVDHNYALTHGPSIHPGKAHDVLTASKHARMPGRQVTTAWRPSVSSTPYAAGRPSRATSPSAAWRHAAPGAATLPDHCQSIRNLRCRLARGSETQSMERLDPTQSGTRCRALRPPRKQTVDLRST
jgi:hypothetical protein